MNLKTWVILGALAIGFLPWFSGGKDPIALLISLFGLLICLLLVLRRQEVVSVSGRPTRWLTLGLLGWSALSLLWTANRYQTEQWVLYLVLAIVAWYLTRLLTRAEQHQLLNLYLGAAAVFGAYGLYLYEVGDYNRLTGSFYWANPAAAFLLPAIVLSTAQLIVTHKRQYFVLNTWFVLLFMLTYSRGATLVIGVVALTALLIIPLIRRNWVILLFSLVLAFGLSTGANEIRTHAFHHGAIDAASRFGEAARGESTSVKDRVTYLGDAFDIWLTAPVQGTGAGTFGTVHPQHQERVTAATTSAHNFYIQTLTELGVVGFGLLVWLVAVLLIGMARGTFNDPSRLPAAVAAAALLLHFGLDIDQRYPALIVLLAVLIACAYPAPKKRPVTGWRVGLVPGLAVVAIAFAISNYQSSVWADRGSVLNDNRDFTHAATAFERAHTGLMYDPDQWTAEGIDYYTLAAITNGSKSYGQLALDRADQAITRDPEDSQHYLLKARTERLAGDYTAAEKDYNRALALDDLNHPDYYADLAELKLLQGDSAAAQKVTAHGLALYPPTVVANRSTDKTTVRAVSELYTIRALDELSTGKGEAASKDIATALKLDPRNSVALKMQKGVSQIKQLIAP